MGFNVVLTDTAGLRESEDIIEKEGIKLAREQAGNSDAVILVVDASELEHFEDSLSLTNPQIIEQIESINSENLLILLNKIDKLP
jgi:tRNA modification GTPase